MTTMRTDHVLANYRDGDEHGWATEFDYLHSKHPNRLAALRDSIATEGMHEPIHLGSDGRVWDGHHRLCVAVDLGLTEVPVTFSAAYPTRIRR